MCSAVVIPVRCVSKDHSSCVFELCWWITVEGPSYAVHYQLDGVHKTHKVASIKPLLL